MHLAILDPHHPRAQCRRKDDFLTLCQLAQGLGQCRPCSILPRLQQGHLDACRDPPLPAVAPAFAAQPCRDHLGIVQHQPVTGLQDLIQLIDHPVLDPVALRQEQTRRRPRTRRTRGNQVFGQIKIEIGQKHGDLSLFSALAFRQTAPNPLWLGIAGGKAPETRPVSRWTMGSRQAGDRGPARSIDS